MVNKSFTASPPRPGVHFIRPNATIYCWLPWLAYLALGAAAGMLLPNASQTQLAETYVAYYWQADNFARFLPVFVSLLSAAWLQLTVLAVLGLNVLGPVLLPAFYLMKGCLGIICVKTALLSGGTKGLVVFWLLSWLPELGLLAVTIPLCRQMSAIASQLFQLVFYKKSAVAGEAMTGTKIIKKYLSAMLLSAALCFASAWIAVFFALLLLR